MRRIAIALLAAAVLAVAIGPVAIRLRERDDGRTLPGGVAGRILQVGGHRVHVVERGEGAALVLVHGFGASTFDYEEHVLEPLARSHRAIAVDLFGFGWSERSDGFDYGWTLWSDEIAGTLDALGIERASIAGHSMGGAVAAVFAARHPERVERLVLADALYPQQGAEVPLVFRVLRTPVLGELALGLAPDPSAPGSSPALRARTRLWDRIAGTRRAWLEYVRDDTKRAALAAAYPVISAPTLILHGTADESVAYTAMERSAPAIRGARIVPIPGGRHFILRDHPEIFVREVGEFLAAEASDARP